MNDTNDIPRTMKMKMILVIGLVSRREELDSQATKLISLQKNSKMKIKEHTSDYSKHAMVVSVSSYQTNQQSCLRML